MGEGEIRENGVGRTHPDASGLESFLEKIRTHGHRMMTGGVGYPYAGETLQGIQPQCPQSSALKGSVFCSGY